MGRERTGWGIPEALLEELAAQFDEFGGILTVDGTTQVGKIGILHLIETTDSDGQPAIQMPPFRHEIIDLEKESSS